MAHVLLPCDLPSWPDVQRQLLQLKECKDGAHLVEVMINIYEICCISLDPEDLQPRHEHAGFKEFRTFIEDILTEDEKSKFLKDTLLTLVTQALNLPTVKPVNGFLYSLKKEECTFQLERAFVSSLLANAFFSTFPKRNSKTHPTLQDFSLADFFTYLTKRGHQKKLKIFLRYFENMDPKPQGKVEFTRKVVSGPSLPGWLCSDRSLAPLVVRSEGTIHEAEPRVFRACPCSALIGGDVLKASSSQEAKLFFAFPELIVILSFVESLSDNESLLVEGLETSRVGRKQRGHTPSAGNFCFLDAETLAGGSCSQYEDRCLLRELNKALAAFLHEPRDPPPEQRRQTPVGESSGSSEEEMRAYKKPPVHDRTRSSGEKKENRDSMKNHVDRDEKDKKSPYFPTIPVSKPTSGALTRRSSGSSYADQKVSEWPKIPVQKVPSRMQSSSRSSSKLSMKTASQSSVELPPIQPVREDEYYTADEDSGEGNDTRTGLNRSRIQRDKRVSVAMTDLLKEESDPLSSRRRPSQSLSRETSSEVSRSESVGFVLGGDSEEDCGVNMHERLDDFRKRIRKRTRRRLSRRSSRSSYLGSSGSSDMEDISEDPEIPVFHQRPIRPASSEPSLMTAVDEDGTTILDYTPLSPAAETALLSLGGKKMMVTSSNGHLKAYSYDGVNPNLPVPFKAKFRRRRHHSEEGEKDFGKGGNDFLWSSSLMERCSSVEDLSSYSGMHSERSSSALVRYPEAERQKIPTRCPVAVEPWACCRESGDSQLKAVILWLAASMADLPALFLYTLQEPLLKEIVTVYAKVLNRHWTVGDLSCEVLRFCRNRISPKRRMGAPIQLFNQLIGSEAATVSSLSQSLSQHSLD